MIFPLPAFFFLLFGSCFFFNLGEEHQEDGDRRQEGGAGGQEESHPKDYRLVFEIEFVKQLYDDYVKTELEIWHTYTDTSLEKIIRDDV